MTKQQIHAEYLTCFISLIKQFPITSQPDPIFEKKQNVRI